MSAGAVPGTAPATGRVVLTDVSSEMLVAARERADGEGLEGVECVVMDGDELDFDPASFDAVISRHGLQFLADVPAALRRLHSFLKTEAVSRPRSGGLRSASDSRPRWRCSRMR